MFICFFPPFAHTHHESPSFKPGKLNSGLGFDKSLPRAFEKKEIIGYEGANNMQPPIMSVSMTKTISEITRNWI